MPKLLLTVLTGLFVLVSMFVATPQQTEARAGVTVDTVNPKINDVRQDIPLRDRLATIYAGSGGNIPRIAVIINGDENMLVEERVKNKIYEHLRKKFPRNFFNVVKGTDINTMLLQYAEEQYYDKRETATIGTDTDNYYLGTGQNFAKMEANDEGAIGKYSKVDVDGMPVGLRPRGLADMRREDYVRIGRKCGYDYVFVITLSNGQVTSVSSQWWVLFRTHTVRKNIWLRMRFIDMATGDYLYRNDIPAEGETHNGYINGRIAEYAIDKAMTEAMSDLSVDYNINGYTLPPAPNSYR